MESGYLKYNSDLDRIGVYSGGLWIEEGFHCGEVLEVCINGTWQQKRIEYNNQWYLAGYGSDIEGLEARI